jgi:hypothetical protein
MIKIETNYGKIDKGNIRPYAEMLPHLLVAYSNLISSSVGGHINKRKAMDTFIAIKEEIERVYDFSFVEVEEETEDE